MKYIRTKDRETGLAIILESEHYYHNELCYCGAESQADTIEELCDEFVIKPSFSKPFLHDNEKQEFNAVKDRALQIGCFEIYGAIWTDKGLIYVAKMNEEGELVLL